MSHPQQLDIKSYVDRLLKAYQGDAVKDTHRALIGALRRIPPDMRAAEAQLCIDRLAKQEQLELRIKAMSDEELARAADKLG
jgi:hypothetical protein